MVLIIALSNTAFISAANDAPNQNVPIDIDAIYRMNSGLSRSQAEIEAAKVVAYPGTSEHNLGLAVDIVSLGYQLLDNKQATTAEVRWLVENCADYGFILRYPQGKESITGIIYEPWHFRYVGVTAAQEIMDSGMCLEEYLSRQP